MSGFEIAGIVLGVLPLLISAAEHYQSSLDPAIAFFKWKDELKKALRELWLQHSSFQLTLQNLLREVATPEETQRMLSDFQHQLWKSTELSDRLERRLNGAYKVYLYTMQEMESYLRTLAGHLDLRRQKGIMNDLEAILLANPPAMAHAHGNAKFEFRWRIKFTMKRKEIRSLLQEIKTCNERLDQFIQKSQSTNPSPSHVSKPTICPSVQQIQDYAISLHNKLSGAWSCSPQSPHQVHLILEHRMIKPDKLSLRASSNDRDTAQFTISCNSPSSPGNWTMAEIRVTGKSPDPKPQTCNNPSTITANATKSLVTENRQSAQDLCLFFCRQPQPGCFGFELNPDGKLWVASQAQSHAIRHAEQQVSLEELLLPSQGVEHRPFTEEEKYLLAITVASSMLQLHVTPWLTGSWAKKNILFTKYTDSQQTTIDVVHPFLSTQFQQKADGASILAEMAEDLQDSDDDDSINLLTLAMLLLEIKLGNRGERQSYRTSNGPKNASDFLELRKWMISEKGNISFAYRDAVSYCMQCAVNPAVDLKDADFRQKMVDCVVVPLLKELEYWRGGVP